MTAPQGRKIAIIGASGQVGVPLVDTLLSHGVHTITTLQRPESHKSFPESVIVKTGDLTDEDFLASSLAGQDVLVLAPPMSHILSISEPAVRAAARVGVPYILPSEYGPPPGLGQQTSKNPLLQTKKQVRDLIEELGVSKWVAIATGPWLDMHIPTGSWGVDVKKRRATLLTGDGAKIRASTASIRHSGEAAAAVLGMPEEELARFKNGTVYAASFHLTQRDMLDAVQRVTGTTDQDWEIVQKDFSEWERDYQQGSGEWFYKFFATHLEDGWGADWEDKVDKQVLAKLEKLGLKEEKVDDVVRAALL